MMVLLALMLIVAGQTAHAQVRPQPGTGNPHIQSVEYQPDQIVQIEAAPGYQVTIEFAADERIENVALGDSGAWQVTANRRGDRLFVKPIRPGISTNMMVVTDTRSYGFELLPAFEPHPDVAWSVTFRYPNRRSAAPTPSPAEGTVGGRYKLRGTKTLRPSHIHDDGVHTYILWPEDRALPAVYAVNDQGEETLVNGMMRDGRMVVDSVQRKLVFRIDRRSAVAERIEDRR